MIIPDSAIGTMKIYSGDRGKCNEILRKIFLEVMFNFKRFSYVRDILLVYFVALRLYNRLHSHICASPLAHLAFQLHFSLVST